MSPRAEVGVLGGSGFYALLKDVEKVRLDTPHGPPSDELAVGDVGGRSVAFLPRHGAKHTIPPAAINYRANLWAMREIGVSRVIAPTASGSLQPHVKPGEFVVCDQFVDRTWGRPDSFYDRGPSVAHVAAADPYCPELRSLAVETARELGVSVHDRGTVVVIQGPRFSTRAESRCFAGHGWEVINMTQYPEVILARELEMCYANISLITDFDVGLEDQPGIEPVTVSEVERVFKSNNERVRELILRLVPRLPPERGCACGQAMQHAFIGH